MPDGPEIDDRHRRSGTLFRSCRRMVEPERQVPPPAQVQSGPAVYIRDQVAARFGRDPRAARPFEGLRFLDIGCGGGLLCEPMARLGADVVGADASATNIEVAKLHAAEAA